MCTFITSFSSFCSHPSTSSQSIELSSLRLHTQLLTSYLFYMWAPLVAQKIKNLPAMQETQVQSLGWEDPLEKGMAPTLVFLPGKFHRQRSLAGYSSRDHKESNMTERLTHTHTHTQYIGQWHSPSSCPPQLPSLPCVCFLSWRLYSCPANRFICTIFLDSIYIHLYVILVFHRLS